MHGSKGMITKLVMEIVAGSASITDVEIVLCPPSVYLSFVENQLREKKFNDRIQIGAQNVYCERDGAYTGEISPLMLSDIGCQYVILGHSERRQLFAEDDGLIARKFVAAYHAGLISILCVGETAIEREQGKTFEVVSRQMQAVFELAPLEALQKAVVAYEPVWAIGTGLTATPDQAEEVHNYLRSWMAKKDAKLASRMRILYGGSVKAENAKGLFAKANIDGALVGGASLSAKDFLNICENIVVRI
jgi:triosephosphate isomerase